jgi:hypothetical protein
MSFKNLQGGQKVKFWMPNGLKLVNGKAIPEYKATIAKVQPMLTFADHVVVNLGGKYGKPFVVNASNFIGAI